jgi:hypothetical protein
MRLKPTRSRPGRDELRNLGLEVVCLDARNAHAALKVQNCKTNQNAAEGLA